MAYTIINSSIIEMTRGSEYQLKIIASSSKDSAIESIYFKSNFLGIEKKELEKGSLTNQFVLSFSADDTMNFNVGNGYYYLFINYEDGTGEEKPYVGMVRVRDLEAEINDDEDEKEEGG